MESLTTPSGVSLTDKFTREDLEKFLGSLRDEDYYEMIITSHTFKIDTIMALIIANDFWMVKDKDGNPAVLLGLTEKTDGTMLTFLCTKYFDKSTGYNFLKYGRKLANDWFDQHDYIWSLCYKRASHHFKFLKTFKFKANKVNEDWLHVYRQKE